MRPFADRLRSHWPEYLMEAAGLGIFMVSACAFGALLWHPDSPVSRLVADGVGRRGLMGLAMGLQPHKLVLKSRGFDGHFPHRLLLTLCGRARFASIVAP